MLGEVPEDEKYNIRQRSRELQNKWAAAFGGGEAPRASAVEEPADASAIPDKPATSPVKTNGDAAGAAEVEMKDTAPAPVANGDATMTDATA